MSNKVYSRWSKEEEDTLLRQVSAFPQNLHTCFIAVSEQIGRTPGAVANHWYSRTSKSPKAHAFGLMTQNYYSKNRKNGVGVEISHSVWNRFCNLIKAFI